MSAKGPLLLPAPATRRRNWAAGALLVVLVFVAYLPVWRGGFIWDDDFHLTENACVRGPLGFKAIWTSSASYYYPLVTTSFWLGHKLWGLNATAFHLVNIAVHAGCALLLWRLLRRLNVPAAWLGAAAWALHPVQVESVAWITELKNTQSCFFYLAAALFFLEWRERRATEASAHGANTRYALAIVCAVLAITSKTSTVMLPVALGFGWWWLERRWRWSMLLWLSPFFVVSFGASAWTIWEQRFHSGALGPEWDQSALERCLIAGQAAWFYLGKLFWPSPLMFIYPRWQIDLARVASYVPALSAVCVLSLLWLDRHRRWRPGFFAAAYFVALLFPVLGFFNIYFFRYSFVADHFQYLASIGPIVFVTAAIGTGIAKLPTQRSVLLQTVAATAVVVALGAMTFKQTHVYRDADTLWRDALRHNSRCWLAEINLGKEADKTGRTDDAIDHYQRALALYPQYPEMQNLLGNTLWKRGRAAEAEACYRYALLLKPDYAEPCTNLGVIALDREKPDTAARYFRRALSLDPQSTEAHNGLGNALLRLGRANEAVGEFTAAVALNPQFSTAHYNLGNALTQLGRTTEAIESLRIAIRLDPKSAEAQNNLGVVLYNAGRYAEAITCFEAVVALTPNDDAARNNLGNALRGSGRISEAAATYRRALEVNPKSLRAQKNLAAILAVFPDAKPRDEKPRFAVPPSPNAMRLSWARGVENQRQADLGNGYFLNPILGGDHPAPAVLHDGDEYVLVHASREYIPGLPIWHSRDLVNWEPLGSALNQSVGSVDATDIARIGGHYVIYFSARQNDGTRRVYAVWAATPRGPWSTPIDLRLPYSDPAHVETADAPYLLLAGGWHVRLAPDGLATAGPPERLKIASPRSSADAGDPAKLRWPHVWHHGAYYHLIATDTSAPDWPTLVTLRAKSADGPWEYAPHNPIVRGNSSTGPWRAKRGGCIVDGAAGGMFVVYTAREEECFSLGDEVVLQTIEIAGDWVHPRLAGHDISRPIRKSGGDGASPGQRLSDDFAENRIGSQWSFYRGTAADPQRCRYEAGTLMLAPKGESIGTASPLTCVPGDQAYEIEVEVTTAGRAGLALLRDASTFVGIEVDGDRVRLRREPGSDTRGALRHGPGPVRLRLRNERAKLELSWREDGRDWTRFDGPLGLTESDQRNASTAAFRPALYAIGTEARFRNFAYRALP